jgi:hypothetical protein
MVERVVKATLTGWRPWALGAALSMGLAALLVHRWQRAEWRKAEEAYQGWWRHRERARANGDQRPVGRDRADQAQLFV